MLPYVYIHIAYMDPMGYTKNALHGISNIPPITFNISHVPKPSESNVYKVNTESGIRPSHLAGPCNPRSVNCHSQTPNSFYSWSMIYIHIIYIYIYILVGGFHHLEKYESHLGLIISYIVKFKMLETTHQFLYLYIYIYIYSGLLHDRWSLDPHTAGKFQRTGSFQHVFFFLNHQPALDSPLTTALFVRNQTCFLPPAAALG